MSQMMKSSGAMAAATMSSRVLGMAREMVYANFMGTKWEASAFALAFVFRGHGNLMIGARKGSPLAIGHGDGEMYLGSDAIALAPFTDTISYLEDGDWVVLTREVGVIYNAQGTVTVNSAIKDTKDTASPRRP